MSASVKNSVSVENLAEVSMIFSDKTGTMTKNLMCFHDVVTDNGNILQAGEHQNLLDKAPSCIFSLGLCHTVLVMNDLYQGESPDEVALVKGAAEAGLKLVNRTSDKLIFNLKNHTVTYKIIAVIPFSSARKKMSIVL